MSNKALDSARRKGAVARKEDERITQNPYGDARTHNGSVTFARAFFRAWEDGWRTADKILIENDRAPTLKIGAHNARC
jgi:hypothetical protein